MVLVAEAEGQRVAGASARGFYRWELDVVRVCAFLLVFFQHALPGRYTPSGRPANVGTIVAAAGGFGVRLFFVLSAYLLTRLLLIEFERAGTIAIRAFYLRRTLRIWPLYFVLVLLSIPFH